MGRIFQPKIVIDATKPSETLFSTIQFQYFSALYKPHYTVPFNNQPAYNVILSHSVVQFIKPERTSKKDGTFKPQQVFYYVLDPLYLGTGSYGKVHPVVGTWSLNSGKWSFKTKAMPYNQRVMKTNIDLMDRDPDRISQSYQSEFKIGNFIKPLNSKYPAQRNGNISTLVSKKIPGKNLSVLIANLYQNPNYMSSTDKLKLTINLLKALEEQVTGKTKLAQDQAGIAYLIHCDLKPENIMVADDLTVEIIDYGNSAFSDFKYKTHGTTVYKDPLLLTGKKARMDHTTDLASMYRVISELWGDNSIPTLKTVEDVINRNKKNNLKVLEGITDLNAKEKEILSKILHSGTSCEDHDRLTRVDALKEYESFLNNHLEAEHAELNRLATIVPLEDLSADDLIKVFDSNMSDLLLDRFSSQHALFYTVIQKMGLRIFDLKLEVLTTINQSFAHLLASKNLKNVLQLDTTVEQIDKIIQLGTPVTDGVLKAWFNSPLALKNGLKWAQIGRLLFKHNPNYDLLGKGVMVDPSFPSIFVHQFLLNDKASSDDITNVRLIQRHIKVCAMDEAVIKKIKDVISRSFEDTPLAKAVLENIEAHLSSQGLRLQQEEGLNLILRSLCNRQEQHQNIINLPRVEAFPARDRAINMLTKQMQIIMNSDNDSWEEALLDFEDFDNKLQVVLDLDQILMKIRQLGPYSKRIFSIIHNSLNNYYSFELPMPKNTLIQALCKIENIINNKNSSTHLNSLFSADSQLEINFSLLINSISFETADEFLTEINKYHSIYTETMILFNQLVKNVLPINQLRENSELKLKEIEMVVWSIRPIVNVDQYMNPIRNKVKALLAVMNTNSQRFFQPEETPDEHGKRKMSLDTREDIDGLYKKSNNAAEIKKL